MSPDADQSAGRMREVTEQSTLEFPCSACGAKLNFAAGTAALACGHCGHEEAIPTSKEEVVEHDVDDYQSKGERGWGTEQTKTYDCRECGAKTTADAKHTSFTCPFCGSPQVDQADAEDLHRPESIIPFVVDERKAGTNVKTWIASLWFRPSALKKLAQLGQIRGVYIPHWTYDSMTHSFWEAQSGYYYYETESYTDSEGNSQTRQVRKTRWKWTSGKHQAFFDDVLVCASKGVDPGLMVQAYPYDTTRLVNYDPRFLAGWAAENYRRTMLECWPDAREFIDGKIRTACAAKVPGDTHRSLSVESSYMNKTYKHCLLPLWFGTYHFKNIVWPLMVNGQTGEVVGKAPYSWVKITLLVLGILGTIALIVTLASK